MATAVSWIGLLVGVLVFSLGMVAAIVRWRHHPNASLLVVIGLAILILGRLLFIVSYLGISVPILVFTVSSLISNLATGLVIIAVFLERRSADDRVPDLS